MPDSLPKNATQRKENLIEKAKQNLGLNREKVLSLFEMFKLIVTFPIWYPKSLYNKAQEKGPLPKDFDFTYALTAYNYRATSLIFYTLGIRLAIISPMKSLLKSIFSPIPLFLIAFILMPIFAFLIHKKCSLRKLSLIDRRVLLLVHSFLSGLLVSHLLRHYISQRSAPPIYFFPIVIYLVIYLFGSNLSSNRVTFALTTVGPATLLSFLISSTIAGPITLNALASIGVQTICALISVQNMIHEVIVGETDLILSNTTGLALTMYTYFFYKVLFCRYDAMTFDQNLPSFKAIFTN